MPKENISEKTGTVFTNLSNVWLKRKQLGSPVCFCVQSVLKSLVACLWEAPLDICKTGAKEMMS